MKFFRKQWLCLSLLILMDDTFAGGGYYPDLGSATDACMAEVRSLNGTHADDGINQCLSYQVPADEVVYGYHSYVRTCKGLASHRTADVTGNPEATGYTWVPRYGKSWVCQPGQPYYQSETWQTLAAVDFYYGGTGEPDDDRFDDQPGPPSCSDPAAANPILISTGNKYQAETDYSASGPLPLVIERRYNSASGEWRFSGQSNLDISTNEVLWTQETGKQVTFAWSGSVWQATGEPTLTLVQLVGGWQIATKGNLTYEFDGNGRLLSMADLSENTHTYTYDAQGRLEAITHSNGDQLTYSYNAENRIASITIKGEDFYAYGYSAEGYLTSVTYPGQTKPRTYHYEDLTLLGYLTGITDERGVRYATWGYDIDGRAVFSEHANGAGRYQLTFNPGGSTTVTNPLGKKTTYRYTEINGTPKVVQVEGHVSANCAAANKAYTYNAEGLRETQTDWEGNITRFIYNSRGLETSRIEAEGIPEERTIQTEWHSDFNLPVKIIEPERETHFAYDSQGRLLTRTIKPRITP